MAGADASGRSGDDLGAGMMHWEDASRAKRENIARGAREGADEAHYALVLLGIALLLILVAVTP